MILNPWGATFGAGEEEEGERKGGEEGEERMKTATWTQMDYTVEFHHHQRFTAKHLLSVFTTSPLVLCMPSSFTCLSVCTVNNSVCVCQ